MKLIDFYNIATDKQRTRLMEHIDNITAKERSPRKEKKKPKKTKRVSAVRTPAGSSYYD